jgi:hypothetical protein
MGEHYLLVLSGLAFLLAGSVIVSLLRWHTPHVSSDENDVEPYVGEFVPAETQRQQSDRENYSAWLMMIRHPELGRAAHPHRTSH